MLVTLSFRKEVSPFHLKPSDKIIFLYFLFTQFIPPVISVYVDMVGCPTFDLFSPSTQSLIRK